jgi:hypothetical protein
VGKAVVGHKRGEISDELDAQRRTGDVRLRFHIDPNHEGPNGFDELALAIGGLASGLLADPGEPLVELADETGEEVAGARGPRDGRRRARLHGRDLGFKVLQLGCLSA